VTHHQGLRRDIARLQRQVDALYAAQASGAAEKGDGAVSSEASSKFETRMISGDQVGAAAIGDGQAQTGQAHATKRTTE
jgi:hypothetical protein